jgi:hypothetical protein
MLVTLFFVRGCWLIVGIPYDSMAGAHKFNRLHYPINSLVGRYLEHFLNETLAFGTSVASLPCNSKIPLGNLKMIPTNKLAMLCTAFCAVMLAFSHNASALTIGDSNHLGLVHYGIPSGDDNRTAYVNYLIGMALGTTEQALGQTFTRSNNDFGTLPTAVFAFNGTGTTINLGAGGYSYLLAKYDGPNYGSEVWYVGGLSGIITIPATGGRWGLSGWTLFGGQGVPDGGTTVMLLGAALGALGMARRYLSS